MPFFNSHPKVKLIKCKLFSWEQLSTITSNLSYHCVVEEVMAITVKTVKPNDKPTSNIYERDTDLNFGHCKLLIYVGVMESVSESGLQKF